MMFKGLKSLSLCLAFLAGLTPTQTAAGIFTIEQGKAEAEILVDSPIYQRPSKEGEQIGRLIGGSRITVTGKVVETKWYRVSTEEVAIGYVLQDYLRAVDEGGTQLGLPSDNGEVQQAAIVDTATAGKVFRDCPECPEMVILPPGSFTMGDNDSPDITQRPAHRVTLTQSLALGKYEVTVAQWMACVDASACSYAPKGVENPEQMPVRNLSWADAQEYVAWLSKKTGKTYRLPSEAEWEYAARAGTSSLYWWGDKAGSQKANCANCGGEWNKKAPSPMGRYAANGFGLHDMNGGVAEWTADCWFRTHVDAPEDGSARQEDGCSERVLRGGSWRDEDSAISSAARKPYEDNLPYRANGLRVARGAE